MNNNVILVLGMHRSGTSCLTGLLQQAGVELGDVVEEAPYNKKGNRENLEIMALNNAVLSHSNGSWSSPPQKLTWLTAHQRERDRIARRYTDKGTWGFKDPRTLITLPFWLEGLRQSRVRYIGTFRHPLSVAKSLNHRDPDFTLKQGVALWQYYNEKLLEYQRQYQFPLINFDLKPKHYMQSVIEAMRHLEIQLPPDANTLDFFDEALLHEKVSDLQNLRKYAELLDQVMPVYEKLKVVR